MKNNRVNIDRDVRSRQRIAASRPAPRTEFEPQPEIIEPPKDEPKEEIGKEAKATETWAETAPVPAPRPKRSGRPPEGEA